MKKICLSAELHTGITIMVFAEGTILKPKSWLTLYSHNSYFPIGNAVDIINLWQQQGANMIYCTSHKHKQADSITKVKQEIKEKIKSIVVPEFKGIDNLPTDLEKLNVKQ